MEVSVLPYDAQYLHLDSILRNTGSHSKIPLAVFRLTPS